MELSAVPLQDPPQLRVGGLEVPGARQYETAVEAEAGCHPVLIDARQRHRQLEPMGHLHPSSLVGVREETAADADGYVHITVEDGLLERGPDVVELVVEQVQPLLVVRAAHALP